VSADEKIRKHEILGAAAVAVALKYFSRQE
jgi:hypothetical protein